MGNSFRWLLKIFRGNKKPENEDLYNILGFVPKNIEIYKLALIHRSASSFSPTGDVINNERLEFLGDSILGFVLAEYLYQNYPEKREGDLTKLRSRYVNGKNLEKFSKEIGLEKLIVSKTNLKKSVHISGDAVEALIGAIYLDRGFEEAKAFILSRYIESCNRNNQSDYNDYNFKGEIIEWCQYKKYPFRYETIKNGQLKDGRPFFSSILFIKDKPAGCGFGESKKIAEQAASREALYECR
ncbi:MAG TPA: ribonuclease III [Salinivirgaceae bacterium]|nr:ribonuclease III [Salinivirgaceae bacterium]